MSPMTAGGREGVDTGWVAGGEGPGTDIEDKLMVTKEEREEEG